MSDHSITSLIEKLEGAEVGDRMLDAQIWCAVNGLIWKKPLVVTGFPDRFYSFRTNKGDIGLHGDDQRGPVTRVTTSLDAALALAERVLPGWAWQIDLGLGMGPTVQGASKPWTEGLVAPDCGGVFVTAATPALALCAAVLRAQSEARV